MCMCAPGVWVGGGGCAGGGGSLFQAAQQPRSDDTYISLSNKFCCSMNFCTFFMKTGSRTFHSFRFHTSLTFYVEVAIVKNFIAEVFQPWGLRCRSLRPLVDSMRDLIGEVLPIRGAHICIVLTAPFAVTHSEQSNGLKVIFRTSVGPGQGFNREPSEKILSYTVLLVMSKHTSTEQRTLFETTFVIVLPKSRTQTPGFTTKKHSKQRH